ncbi:MAG: GNAT family N-acetyltransferase [Phenylobacterium sp.]
MTEFRITMEPPEGDEVAELLRERDAYFDALYVEEDRNARSVDLTQDSLVFFTVRGAERLVGCAALVQWPDFGELKRFFVRAECRGMGLGRRLVQAIEAEARRRGCARLMLETGVLQPDAIALYRGQGFRERAPFGAYTDDPLSVFMEKALSDA